MREKDHWKKTKQTQIEFGPIPKCILDTDPLAQVKQRRISTSPRIFIWVSMSQPQREPVDLVMGKAVLINHDFPRFLKLLGIWSSMAVFCNGFLAWYLQVYLNVSIINGVFLCFFFAIWGDRYPHCLQATPGHHFQHFHFSQKTRRWRIAEKSPITLISWSGKRAARPGGSRSKENGGEGQPCA